MSGNDTQGVPGASGVTTRSAAARTAASTVSSSDPSQATDNPGAPHPAENPAPPPGPPPVQYGTPTSTHSRTIVSPVDTPMIDFAVREPEPFRGKPASQLSDFIAQLRLVYASQHAKFQRDEAKVIYAISYLRGTALNWAKPYLGVSNPPPWMSSFELFTAELTKQFGERNHRHRIYNHIDSLQQTGSAADYAIEFQQGATILNWADEPLIRIFYKGLKDAVKDELARTTVPDTLTAFIQLTIALDDRLHARHYQRTAERDRELRSPRTAPRRRFPARVQPAPTTANVRESSPPERTAFRPAYQPLTDEQKDYRRRNKLCMYCGDPSHAVINCPVCPSRPRPARGAGATLAVARPQGNAPAQPQ
jgi:hypothetical protein